MQRRQPPRQRTQQVKNRRVDSRARLVLIVFAVIVICVAVYYIRAAAIIGIGKPRFYNVSVNGVSLEGYTREEADALFDSLVADWSDNEYVLTYGDRSWTFTAADFGVTLKVDELLDNAWNLGHYGSIGSRVDTIKAMDEQEFAFTSKLDYDSMELDRFVYDISAEIDTDPVDAQVVLDVDGPKILTESRDGYRLDVDHARETVLNMLLTGQYTGELRVEVISPAVTSTEVGEGMEILSSYCTDMTTSSSSRYQNVKLALSNFNCMAVYDGDTVSFNEVVGERSKERGYKEAAEYAGTSVVTGYGGGSCQASTTLYCAVLMAGCDIIERHPHNMTVAYAEPSLDATVSWGRKDFIFQNNTGRTLYIYTHVTREECWVIVFGDKTEYRMDFQSVVVKPGVQAYKEEIREDVSGQLAYYTDEKVLYSQGKEGCVSQGWLVYYDWETGQEVERKQISQDTYNPGTSIYYVGVHDRNAASAPNGGN